MLKPLVCDSSEEMIMNRAPIAFGLALVYLVTSTAAFAQGGGAGLGGPGMMQGQGPMRGMRGGPIDPAQLPTIKQHVAITAQQESQWKAYADAVTAAWDMRNAMRESVAGQVGAMSQQELQETRDIHRAAMAQAMAEVQQARVALAAVLDADQKTRLDREAPVMPGPMTNRPR